MVRREQWIFEGLHGHTQLRGWAVSESEDFESYVDFARYGFWEALRGDGFVSLLTETQERFKFNWMGEVEDRMTNCAEFACHAF